MKLATRPLQLPGSPAFEILALDSQKRFGFSQFHHANDLYERLMALNEGWGDEFWLIFRVPNDDRRFWDDADLEAIETFLAETFARHAGTARIGQLFGAGFPRSVPCCWHVALDPVEARQ